VGHLSHSAGVASCGAPAGAPPMPALLLECPPLASTAGAQPAGGAESSTTSTSSSHSTVLTCTVQYSTVRYSQGPVQCSREQHTAVRYRKVRVAPHLLRGWERSGVPTNSHKLPGSCTPHVQRAKASKHGWACVHSACTTIMYRYLYSTVQYSTVLYWYSSRLQCKVLAPQIHVRPHLDRPPVSDNVPALVLLWLQGKGTSATERKDQYSTVQTVQHCMNNSTSERWPEGQTIRI